MSSVSSNPCFSHNKDARLNVWPGDGSNDPPEEATEAGMRHVATAEIS